MHARAQLHKNGVVPEIIEISSSSGVVEVVAEERDDVEVSGGRRSEQDGMIVIDAGSSNVAVRCPVGSALRVGVDSGGVTIAGLLGDVRVTSSSGRVAIGRVASADVRSASGKVTVEECEGDCRVVVASGAAEIGRAARLDATLKSGSLVAGPVDEASVTVKSGSARIRATGAGDVKVRSYSGIVTVEFPPGVCPHCVVDAQSGAFNCEPEMGDDCNVSVEAMSGDVSVVVS